MIRRLAPALIFMLLVSLAIAALAASHALGAGAGAGLLAAAAPAVTPERAAEPPRLSTEAVATMARDWLAAQRILAATIQQQTEAVAIATRSFEVERSRYSLGLDPYITLMTSQNALLAARQTLVTLHIQQMTSAVQLVQALGGGWSVQQMPSPSDVTRVRPKY